MPFHLKFASCDKPHLRSTSDRRTEHKTNTVGEFYNGISVGLGIGLAVFVAYWFLGPINGTPIINGIWSTMSVGH